MDVHPNTIQGFPKMVIPLNYPLVDGFSLKNHPFWGNSIYGTLHVVLHRLLLHPQLLGVTTFPTLGLLQGPLPHAQPKPAHRAIGAAGHDLPQWQLAFGTKNFRLSPGTYIIMNLNPGILEHQNHL